ncbi:hypothetical protein [Sphingopyxis sp. MWB1]|uniref:hypothetical protein n=1 Tax=Sphingopyxis sp. MWB1 TaxID=1537715 RepID=UPI00051A228D|nr:hypothetical protein [Sphingopyxis sp. MWB1]
MFFTSLLLAAMAPAPAAEVGTARAAFTKCLRVHMKKSLDAKMSESDYEAALKTVCTKERQTFHAAVITLNRAAGDSAADAAENADMQVEDYHANFTEKFNDYRSTNTMPAD